MPHLFEKLPTNAQKWMIRLMVMAYGAMLIWLVPELRGVLDPREEDTYSEFVWDTDDLPFWSITVFHFLAGTAFTWSGGHFVEGRARRRRIEKARRGRA